MSAWSNPIVPCCAVIALAIALGVAAPALSETTSESGSTDVDGRWIPSFSFQGAAFAQDLDAGVSSRCLFGRPADPGTGRPACRDPLAMFPDSGGMLGTPGPAPLRRPVEDSQIAVTPMVGGTLQLMTPRLELIPGGPRAFLSGEVLTFWGSQKSVAREGSPSQVRFPPAAEAGTENQNALNFSERGLFGSGSATEAEIQTWGWGARAGFAFPLSFRDRRLWLKPSVGWMQYEIDVEGTVVAGLKDDGRLLPNGSVDFLERGPGIRQVSLKAKDSQTFNAIGPGIELEMEAGRVGPLGISIYMFGQALRTLGERSVSLSDTVRCDSVTSPCLSSLVNDIELITDIPPPRFPPPPPADPEDIVSPAGPVPEVGVLYPFPGLGAPVPVLPHGPDEYTATWDFEVDDWGYRGGLGIRVHWLGR